MNNSMRIVMVVAVIMVLGVGGYYVLRQASSPSDAGESVTSDAPDTEADDKDENVAATLTYTDNGFTPTFMKVRSGDTLRIVNASSDALEMDSDPHPDHTDNTELNVGIVEPGASKTFTLTTEGTWGLHNHLDPSDTARVDVE